MRSWKVPGGKIQALAFSPDGAMLATAHGASQSIAFWDCSTGTERTRVGTHGSRIATFDFTPDGARVATLRQSGEVLIWNTAQDETEPVAKLVPPRSDVAAATVLTFCPASGRLVTASALGLNWWDEPLEATKTRRGPSGFHPLPLHSPEVYALRFTPDGTRLLVGRRDLEIWDDSMKGPVKTVLTYKGGGLRSIAVSPDGERAAVRLKNTVRVCRLATGTWETTLHWGREMVYAVAFSRDGRTLLTAGADSTVRCWTVGTWQESNRFDWGIGGIRVVCFSPDGLTCAAGSESGVVVVWDVDG
jgi:dipeptidyl aminopeptidase/acylaminoacyl peptidase